MKGKVAVEKKGFTKQFSEAMIGDVEEVKSYLLWDVLVPAIKDTIVDLIKNGAEAMFHSEGSRRGHSAVKRDGATSYVSYSGYSSGKRKPQPIGRSRTRAMDELKFDSRDDAEDVLEGLVELTMNYGLATVADFYELAGVRSDYTDNKYGWFEVSSARVVRVNGGYIVDLPKPEPID